ncbi:Uncharacterized protein QTN25_004853 [Entamoeba marina]
MPFEEYVQGLVSEHEISLLKQQIQRYEKENEFYAIEIKAKEDEYMKTTQTIQQITGEIALLKAKIQIFQLKYNSIQAKIQSIEATNNFTYSNEKSSFHPSSLDRSHYTNTKKDKEQKKPHLSQKMNKRHIAQHLTSMSSETKKHNPSTSLKIVNPEPSESDICDLVHSNNFKTFVNQTYNGITEVSDKEEQFSVNMKDVNSSPNIINIPIIYLNVLVLVARRMEKGDGVVITNGFPTIPSGTLFVDYIGYQQKLTKDLTLMCIKHNSFDENIDAFNKCISLLENQRVLNGLTKNLRVINDNLPQIQYIAAGKSLNK